MIIVHLIKRNEPKVHTFQYSRLNYLETALRGHYADLIIVHGLKIEDCPEHLLSTMKLVVEARKGLIMFIGDMPISEIWSRGK